MKTQKGKEPISKVEPQGKKTPNVLPLQADYSDSKASWRIGKIQMSDPYGWHSMTSTEVVKVKDKLAVFEKNTWKELFVRNARLNHRIETHTLKCRKARAWMDRNMPDQPYLWTLRLSGAERVWGILSEGAYQIIFWDPEHLIWETTK